MAQPNIVNSTAMAMYVDGHTASDKVAYSNDASLQLNHEPRDITNKDSAGWRQLLEGLRSWSASCAALYFNDPSAYGFQDLFDNWKNRDQVTLYFATAAQGAGGTPSGDYFYYGTAYISNENLNSPSQEDNVVYDISFEGTDELSEGTIT